MLITGAGLIGCHIAHQLALEGVTSVLIDVHRPPPLLGTFLPWSECISFKLCDITDPAALTEVCERYDVDAICHTAARLSPQANKDPMNAVDVNVGGTARVLSAALENGVSRVVVASSTTVAYSALGGRSEGLITEDFPMRVVSESPTGIYPATKLAAEMLAMAYARSTGLNVVIVRYGAVLGALPTSDAGLMASLLHRHVTPAVRGESAVIDDSRVTWQGTEEFIDPRDCAAGTIAALRAVITHPAVYHLSKRGPYTYGEFIGALREVFPDYRIDLRVNSIGGIGDLPRKVDTSFDVAAAANDLAFTAQHSLASSFSYFADMVRHHDSTATDTADAGTPADRRNSA